MKLTTYGLLIVLILSRNIITSGGYGPTDVTLSPPNMTYRVSEGTSLQPKCVTSCYPECQYRWKKWDTIEQKWTRKVYARTDIFQFDSMTPEMSGRYICRVQNDYGEAESLPIEITVLYGPDSVRLSPDSEVYRIEEGRGLPGISCNAECEPHCSFKWYRAGGVDPLSVGSVLVMSAMSRQDTGRYYCMAKNVETGRTVKSPYIEVYVQRWLSITAIPTYEPRKGRAITLQCSSLIPNMPLKFLQWRHTMNGNLIRTIEGSKEGSELVLPSVSYQDSGSYICAASEITDNRNTNVRQTTKAINVQSEPVFQLKTENSFFNGSRIFKFKFISYPPPHKLIWKCNGIILQQGEVYHQYWSNSKVLIKYNSIALDVGGYEAVLEIMKAHVRDAGIYSLNVTNVIGSSMQSMQVDSEDLSAHVGVTSVIIPAGIGGGCALIIVIIIIAIVVSCRRRSRDTDGSTMHHEGMIRKTSKDNEYSTGRAIDTKLHPRIGKNQPLTTIYTGSVSSEWDNESIYDQIRSSVSSGQSVGYMNPVKSTNNYPVVPEEDVYLHPVPDIIDQKSERTSPF